MLLIRGTGPRAFQESTACWTYPLGSGSDESQGPAYLPVFYGDNIMKKLWVLGEAVQDMTVEIDLELLLRENSNIGDNIVLDEALWIRNNLLITAQYGIHEFAVRMNILNASSHKDEFLGLLPGNKYNLKDGILELETDPQSNEFSISVHCEDMSWGGGGLNAARYIRSLAPLRDLVPIAYTDIAMNPPLLNNFDSQTDITETSIIHFLADHSAGRYLEVYLDSLGIEPVLYRPEKPQFRRNFVISRVRSSNRVTDNKIVCRGSVPSDSISEEDILALLNGRASEIGAILVNSIKSKALFSAAYSLCKNNPDVLAIFALTDSTQSIATPLIDDLQKGDPPSQCILIFNEMEVQNFAKRFRSDLGSFMTKAEDVPNLKLFAETVLAIIENSRLKNIFRVYVTLGPRGALGVDHRGQVVYVSTFTKPKATIFDTNTCGDAFCGTIALLEWAKRFCPSLDIVSASTVNSWDEMRYFMAVATAVGYSRATSRLGRVDGREVEDLLGHSYLASEVLGDIEFLRKGRSAFCDRSGCLIQPEMAKKVGITSGLAQLMSTKRIL
jgi:hypothetical protein